MERYPFAKWTAFVGFGLFFWGDGAVKQFGSYLLIGDTIFIAVVLYFAWSLMEDEKAEQWKKNAQEFHKSLNQTKHYSDSSIDSTNYPTESLNTDESPESAISSKNPFDSISYPSSNKSIQQPIKANEQQALKEAHKKSTAVELPDGHIKCGSCKYQNSPDNFLESSAGNLYRKCPQCSAHIQFLAYLKSDGKKYSCPSCKLSGDKSSFFPSSAGDKYLRCPSCPTHFM